MGKSVEKHTKPLNADKEERLLIGLAMNLAKKQLMDGTASSQVISHFLDLAKEERRRSLEKLKAETDLIRAKQEQIDSSKNIEKLYENAMLAMKSYSSTALEDGL